MTEKTSIVHSVTPRHENILGPFLCKPTATSMGFWMAFKEKPASSISIEVYDATGMKVDTVALKVVSEVFQTYLGETKPEALKSEELYTYKIFEGLTEKNRPWVEDQTFTTLSNNPDKELKFVSMSCHGIDAWEEEHGKDESFKMWRILYKKIAAGDIAFAVLGGDQVYMDNSWEEHKDKYASKSVDYRLSTTRDVYFQYWGDEDYQKVLARTPAVLMWDDHDLNDGFGSRLDSFNGKELNENWSLFRNDLSTAFWAFQACRNPNSLDFATKVSAPENLEPVDSSFLPHSNYSFHFKSAQLAFLGLDLRSERNAPKEQLVSAESRRHILEATKDYDGIPLFVLSPVTFTRISNGIEEVLGQFANLFWQYTSSIHFDKSYWKTLTWIAIFFICFIPGLSAQSSLLTGIILSIASIASFYPLGLSRKPIPIKGKPLLTLRIMAGALLFSGILGISVAMVNNSFADAFRDQADNLIKTVNENATDILVLALGIVPSTLLLYMASINKNKEKKFRFQLIGGILFILTFLGMQFFDVVNNTSVWDFIPKLALAFLANIILLLCALDSSGAIDAVAGLDDDIKDAWSSESNEKELRLFLERVAKLKNPVYFLSGDIHTGGLSQISIGKKKVQQITTSPISYVPMGAIVEKLTSGNKKLDLPAKDPVAIGENYFYISERNFGIITLHADKTVTTEFVFEGHDSSMKIKLEDRP